MKIIDLKDKFSNKSKNLGFCIGAGPSLHFQDLDPIKKYLTIATNSGIVKEDWFDMFLTDDWSVRDWQYYHDVADLPCYKLLYKEKMKDYASHFKPEEVIFFDHKCWYDPVKKECPEGGLDLTYDEPLIGSRTSLATSVHVLYILGIKNIVLLGADCCYSKDRKRYFWEYEGEKRAKRVEGKPISWFPDKGKKDGHPIDWHSFEFLKYWRDLAEAIKDKDINIINCSGGLLDCFPKMTLEEALEEYGDKE